MKDPVEVDEKYVGGSEKNKHADKKHTVKKSIVAGIKDRSTNKVSAQVVPEVTTAILTEFIEQYKTEEVKTYTDENPVYHRLYNHETVNYSSGEYVRDQAHTNDMASFWAMLERRYDGIYRHISHDHLHIYVNEFSGRRNIRDNDTIDMMGQMTTGMVGQRLRYDDLFNV